jgi:hypothetical protein
MVPDMIASRNIIRQHPPWSASSATIEDGKVVCICAIGGEASYNTVDLNK